MNVHGAARAVLVECDVECKLAGAARLWLEWQAGRLATGEPGELTDSPGRPARPELLPPQAMPRRQLNGRENHAALIHALAHIEFNAINLALDVVQRFPGLPSEFYRDCCKLPPKRPITSPCCVTTCARRARIMAISPATTASGKWR